MDPHQQLAETQRDIKEIKRDIDQMGETIQAVHTALIGSALGKDGGLVQRIQDCETQLATMERRIGTLSSNNRQQNLYIRIIWAMGGGLLMTVFSLLLSYYFYHGYTPPKLH